MKKAKKLSLLLAAAMTLSTVAGCASNTAGGNNAGGNTTNNSGNDSSDGEKQTISVMCHASWATSDGELAMFDYVEEALGVEIEFEKVPDGSEGEQVIQTRYASGEVPDILLWQPASYVKGRMDLSNFVDVSGDWEANFDAAALATPSYTQDGVLYGAPWGDVTLYGMCYNKQVFADNNIEIPTTWDELYAACETLKANGIIPVYYSGADAWTLQIIALNGFGQCAVGQDFNAFIEKMDTNQMKWVDLDVAKQALDREMDLVNKGYVQETYLSDTYQDATIAMLDGSTAMFPHATWFSTAILDAAPDQIDDVGFFPLPTEDGSEVVTMANPNAMYVSAKGDNIDLAKQVVATLASKEALAEKYAKTEGIPFIQGLEGVELSGINADGMELVNKGVCVPSPVDFTKYTKGPLETYIQEMLIGDKTSEDVLAALDGDFAKQAADAGDENWK